MDISEIKSLLPLSRVLDYYGLKPDKSHRLLCPFHEDKSPSLQVYHRTQTLYCFSSKCKVHGRALDVIDLVMYKENCSKHEAIEKCKALIGDGGTPPLTAGLTRAAVLGKMFIYFKTAVHNSPPAQQYIRSRALDATKLEIGYNTAQFHHGKRKSEALIRSCVEVGLLVPWGTSAKGGGQAYKPFGKYSIVFALRNRQHQVCGLYFRSTLNNDHQRHFYLRDRQGLYPGYPGPDTVQLILTESVIDAATLLQVEFITQRCSVLALYGTNGLTAEHLEAIGQLPHLQELVLWLNADQAGDAATEKHAALLRGLLGSVRITRVSMPVGEDINSLAQSHHDEQIFIDLLAQRCAVETAATLVATAPGIDFSFSRETTPASQTAKLLISDADEIKKLAEEEKEQQKLLQELDTTHPWKLRYSTGTAIYYVQGGIPRQADTMKVMLVVEAAQTGMKARNRIDLYEDKQVEKLCKEMAEKLSLGMEPLQGDLYRLTDLLEKYREQQASGGAEDHTSKAPVLTARERTELEVFAKQPRLIKRLNELLGNAGIIGEERNRIFLLIIAISHKMPEPLHALIQGSSGSGKTRLLKQITDCMPRENVTKLTRLSDKVLYNYPENYFVNRLLCLEDIDGLSEEAEFAFRELQSNGELNSATSIKLENGQITSGQKTVRGPIASLACTTHGEIYEDNMSRVFLLAVDEGPEQTRRIIDYQNCLAAGIVNKEEEEKIKGFIGNFVRILEAYRVINPYARQLQLPPEAHKIRRLNDLLQNFIKMVTLINQYQRRRDEHQRLVTEIEDVETAVAVLLESIVLKVDELDGSLRQFYEQLKSWLQGVYPSGYQDKSFSLREIRQALKVSKTQTFRYMADLVRLEYLLPCGGHSNKGYQYKIAYWDNYTILREKIKSDLDQQVKALKAGTLRNASGTLDPA